MRSRVFLTLVCITFSPACDKLPVWSGEVNVAAREREAVKTCGAGALTAEGAKVITRHPYLQSTTTTSTVVAWGSTEGRGEVVLREPGGDVVARAAGAYAGDRNRQQDRLDAQRRRGKELGPDDILVMRADLTGLEPTHLYCYQLVLDGRPMTEPAPLATAAAPDAREPVRFVVLGDSGTGGAAQLALTRRIAAEPFDFLLFLGDIAYSSGTPTQLETRFFAVYRDFLRYVPAYPSIGNHERRTREGRPYFEAFVLPEPERYYSFDWGAVHFVAIDTTRRDAQQLAWLDRDLAQNRLPWTIVFGHHPMYTNSLRGAQEWIREAFGEILTRHGVDLVITGHEHQYERFRVGDVNYVVSGGGGGQLTRFFGRSRALKQATVHHYLAVAVDARSLVMRAVDIEGKEIETLRLEQKGAAPPAVEVDGKPDPEATPIAPETRTVPDERLHDEPDDDTQRKKVTDPAPTR